MAKGGDITLPAPEAQQIIEQRDPRPDMKGRRQLAETGIEGKRQNGEQGVIRAVVEV